MLRNVFDEILKTVATELSWTETPSLPGNIDKVELFNKYFSDISTVPSKHKRISKSITKT